VLVSVVVVAKTIPLQHLGQELQELQEFRSSRMGIRESHGASGSPANRRSASTPSLHHSATPSSPLLDLPGGDVRFLQIQWLQRGHETMPAPDQVFRFRWQNRKIRRAGNWSDGKNRSAA
jgi:hypothetical protein